MSCKLFTLQGKHVMVLGVVGSVLHRRASRESNADPLSLVRRARPALLKIEMPSGATYSTRPYGAHHSEKGAPQLRYEHKSTPRLVSRQDPEEIPDTKLTLAQRQKLRRLVGNISLGLDVHELMYLSGAFEDRARRKRDSMRRLES